MSRMQKVTFCFVLFPYLLTVAAFSVDNKVSVVQKHILTIPKRVNLLDQKYKEHADVIAYLNKRAEVMTGKVETLSCAETIGCYVDNVDRDLNGAYLTSGAMTHEMCIKFCMGGPNHFKFAALQHYQHCFCGDTPNDPPIYAKRSVSECNQACKGNAAQMCGGGWRNSVFNLTNCY